MLNKKILLQVNSVINIGSTGRIAEEIGVIALVNGWESYIAYGRNVTFSKSSLIKIGNRYDIYNHLLQTRLFDKHGLGSVKATRAFINQVEQIRPNIIHLHNIHGYYLNIELLFGYLKAKSIPVVWTLHDCWSFTGHCSYFSQVNCNKWQTVCNSCPQKNQYPSSLFIDRSEQNFNLKKELFNSIENITIVPVSKWLGKVVEQSFLANKNILVISNGINLEVFSPLVFSDSTKLKYKIGNRFMILGVASVWPERKGLNDYIKLSYTLSEDMVIVLVGLSTKQIKSLPPKIVGIPRLKNISELAKLYASADLVLNLSSEETFGLTTVEGFACGTPSIVYNCTASPELITPETGFVIEKGNIEDLLNAIQTIKLKGKTNYSIACRDRAEKLYNKNDRYMDYINLYESLLK